MKNLAIGMFDSGIGGLTIMKQIIKLLPHEQVVYFGDTARVPYGAKGPDTIIHYSLENTAFLMKNEIKALVVACSTASSCAMDQMRHAVDIPVIGMIEPGVEKATQITKNGKIAVLGTKTTINRGLYQEEIRRLLPEAEIFPIACPLFVPIIEEGFVNHEAAKLIIKEYLKPIVNQVDTVLLGCTHYLMLKDAIQEVMGPGTQIVDSGETCAEKLKELLINKEIQAMPRNFQHKFYVSEDPENFKLRGEHFLGHRIDAVELY